MDTALPISVPSIAVPELRQRLLRSRRRPSSTCAARPPSRSDPQRDPGRAAAASGHRRGTGRELDAVAPVDRLLRPRPRGIAAAAAHAAGAGLDARTLEGGVAAWKDQGEATVPFAAPSRGSPANARRSTASPVRGWSRASSIRTAEFLYVPAAEVAAFAARKPRHCLRHCRCHRLPTTAPRCSFDAFIRSYDLPIRRCCNSRHRARRRYRALGNRRRSRAGLLALSLDLSRADRGRPRAAAAGHGHVRCALPVVPGRPRRTACLESGHLSLDRKEMNDD